MDSGSRARAVENYGRAVISAGRRCRGRARSQRPLALLFCLSCRKTRLPGCNPEAVCGRHRQALSGRQHFADPDARDDLATWGRDTQPTGSALARLDFRAVLVVYWPAAPSTGGEDRG